jgi:predicted amidophosphoribosyltransferase
LVVNIGLTSQIYPPRRRWLTTHFFEPQADPACPDTIVPVLLSCWNRVEDTFEHADQSVLDKLAGWIGLTPADLASAMQRRIASLEEASRNHGVTLEEMYEVVAQTRAQE